jgi:cytochrome c oxidase subunit 4
MSEVSTDNAAKTLFGDVFVWALLVGFTLLSWWLGHAPQGYSTQIVSATILLLTFVKIRLVILHFMEVEGTPWYLRGAFEVWCIGVCTTLVFLIM